MDATKKTRLVICVTVHFSKDRLQFLEKMSDHFAELANQVLVYIVTNAQNHSSELAQIEAVLKCKGFDYEFFIPEGIGHPFLLPWSHFAVVKQLIQDESITHFMYLEDDTLVTKENMDYWLESYQILAPLGLIPSFLRVEKNNHDQLWYSSDVRTQFRYNKLPRVYKNKDYQFINLPHPYQGMYLLTRELMLEHLASPSSNPEFGEWAIRERAAQGLTFQNVPKGCTSRNFIGYNSKTKQIDPKCLIHHLPNNYANRDVSEGHLGSITVNEIIQTNEIGLQVKKIRRSITKKLSMSK